MNDQGKPQVHTTGAAGSAETARSLIRKARRATRRRFRSEDNTRILMEGIRGELAVAAALPGIEHVENTRLIKKKHQNTR